MKNLDENYLHFNIDIICLVHTVLLIFLEITFLSPSLSVNTSMKVILLFRVKGEIMWHFIPHWFNPRAFLHQPGRMFLNVIISTQKNKDKKLKQSLGEEWKLLSDSYAGLYLIVCQRRVVFEGESSFNKSG